MATVVADLSHGTRLDRVRRGDVAVIDAGGTIVAAGGEPSVRSDSREVVAPLLAVPLVASGAAEAFGFTTEEIATSISATCPTPLHRALVSSMLGKVRAGLQRDRPDAVAALDTLLGEAGGCSAQLAGMIATCCHAGMDPTGLRAPDHPAHGESHAVVAAARAGFAPRRASQGAGRPEPRSRASLLELASMYAVLAEPEGAQWAGAPPWRAAMARIRDAILSHPDLASHADAPDTSIICATDGQVLARLDPAGLVCLAVPGRGLGIAIRDGGVSPQGLAGVAVEVLEELGVVDAVTAERLSRWLGLLHVPEGEQVSPVN